MKITMIFLRSIVVLAGVGVLALMLWIPPHEGRNAGATLFEVYFKDPFLAYVYIGSIPFFAALYQVFKLLGYIGRDDTRSPVAAKALRTIKYCALANAGLIAGAVVYVFMTAGANDDPVGFVIPGVLAVLVSLAAAAAAAVFEKKHTGT